MSESGPTVSHCSIDVQKHHHYITVGAFSINKDRSGPRYKEKGVIALVQLFVSAFYLTLSGGKGTLVR